MRGKGRKREKKREKVSRIQKKIRIKGNRPN